MTKATPQLAKARRPTKAHDVPPEPYVGLSQSEKFKQAALEHGIDGDEEAFKGVLRKLAKPK